MQDFPEGSFRACSDTAFYEFVIYFHVYGFEGFPERNQDCVSCVGEGSVPVEDDRLEHRNTRLLVDAEFLADYLAFLGCRLYRTH